MDAPGCLRAERRQRFLKFKCESALIGADVEGLFEMALQPCQLAFDVVAKSGGDFNLLAVGFDTHREPPDVATRWVTPWTNPGPQHRTA